MPDNGLINVPATEIAKIKITPLESLNKTEESFYFTVDFYACQESKNHNFENLNITTRI